MSGPVSWPCGVMDVWHSVCDRVKAPGNEDGKLGLSVRSLVPYQRDELTLNQEKCERESLAQGREGACSFTCDLFSHHFKILLASVDRLEKCIMG